MPETTTLTIDWSDLLEFGRVYEHFNDLLAERISDELNLNEDDEVFIYDYGFNAVVDSGAVEVEVIYEVDGDDEEEVYWKLTKKGELVATLIKLTGLGYDEASALTDAIVDAAREVVDS